MEARELRIEVNGKNEVTGLLLRPPKARWLVVLAHGAGADMRHASMEGIAAALASAGLATLADLDLLRPIVERLGARATLHVADGADHSFHVLKRSGRTDDEVLAELVARVASWAGALAR